MHVSLQHIRGGQGLDDDEPEQVVRKAAMAGRLQSPEGDVEGDEGGGGDCRAELLHRSDGSAEKIVIFLLHDSLQLPADHLPVPLIMEGQGWPAPGLSPRPPPSSILPRSSLKLSSTTPPPPSSSSPSSAPLPSPEPPPRSLPRAPSVHSCRAVKIIL
eukprot:767626-Hanusia_phi.AAC.2